MISIDYSYNGVSISAAVATDKEARSLADAIYATYGIWPEITAPAKPVHPFKTGDKIRVSAWDGEWYVIRAEDRTLWLRPWQRLGEPIPAPVSLCELV